jgi:pyrimidine-nucleoside phosphorylase
MLIEAVESGKALNKLKEFIAAQGGDTSCIDDTKKLPKARYIIPVAVDKEGYVSKINAQNIGLIAMELGAGRATKESIIDLAVGIVLNKKRGDKVEKGDVIAYVHANDEQKGKKASEDILNNYIIEPKYENNIPLVYDIVR